jgi:predicted ATPase/DNA-binding winged helix-turn-helix (wHTH) protein
VGWENGATVDDETFIFGSFRLIPAQRALLDDGKPLRLGNRALDILITLVEHAGETISKEQLIAHTWPDTVVDDGALRVHIGALRKALGDGRAGRRYVANNPGRGYAFVAPVTREHPRPATVAPNGAAADGNLPALLTRIVGRHDVIVGLAAQLARRRFLTIVGPGGIGKTTGAVAVASAVRGSYNDGAWFVGLASLSDPALVPSALAAALGIPSSGANLMQGLAAWLRDKTALIVLDSCEHVIAAAAALAEAVLKAAPGVSILATSREPLRAEGETLHRLAALELPSVTVDLAAAEALGYSAVELFNERATATTDSFVLDDANVPAVLEICRRLDGVPLALELAAARVDTFGVGGVAARLDDRFSVLTGGRRTALPRQQTLRATMDWSYHLLPKIEKVVLQRLSVFRGTFAMEAAGSVVGDDDIRSFEVIEIVANLSQKSLVATDISRDIAYHYMHDTTRAYAFEKLTESGELQEFSRRHAEYYRGLLERIEDEWETRPTHLTDVDNVRAALEWCFGVNGDLEIAVRLAAAAAPVFLVLSLVPECHRWSKRALTALDDATRGGSEEMHLQASLGVSSMQMYGQGDAGRVALNRSLAIAETRGDALSQVGLLGMLSMFHTRDGDFKTALHYAKLSRATAGTVKDPAAMALARSTLGRSLHFMGNHSSARAELEASVQYQSRSRLTGETYLGLDRHILDSLGLARTLWLQGHPSQSAECTRQTVKDAESRNHPASLAVALSWAPGIFLWIGDLRSAEEHADWLISHAESHSLGPYLAVGHGYKGALAVRKGDAMGGVESLQACLEQLRTMRYQMRYTEFKLSLVQGLVGIGQFADGMTLVDESIRLIEASGELLYMPEVLRMKGNVILSFPQRRAHDAQTCFIQSLDWSRRQDARSWELRTAVDLAALWAGQGQRESARALLSPIFEQFVEGLDTADLIAAEHLLAALQ